MVNVGWLCACALLVAGAACGVTARAASSAGIAPPVRHFATAIPTPDPSPVPTPSASRPAAAAAGRMLDVPLIAQVMNLSCEAASLQMALAYEGRRVGQTVLLADMRPDYSKPRLRGGVVVSWSDPSDHFVGDPAGHEYDHTGYGVYYPVVARVARAVGARVDWAGTGLTWDGLERLVTAGDPVVVWIAYDGSSYGPDGPVYRYRADDGAEVLYAPGFEHTVTVAGITGDSVLVLNPRWGHRDWLSRSEFSSAVAPFGGMAVALAS